MDFIDFDSFNEDNLPQPQPPLSLPILPYKINERFSLSSILSQTPEKPTEESKIANDQTKLAERYAKLSLNLISKEKINTSIKGSTTYNEEVNTLSIRLSRILNQTVSDQVLKDSLYLLEKNYFDENNDNLIETGIIGSISRRNLKNDIENDLIKNQLNVLKKFQPIYTNLKKVEKNLGDLNNLNSNLNGKISRISHNGQLFNDKFNNLNNEKNLIHLKKNLLVQFKANFSLNEFEEHYLMTGDINDDEYFQILAKAEKIYENCSILLSMNNPTIGIKIMSKMKKLIDISEDKIQTYSLKQFDLLDYDNSNSVNGTLLIKCLSKLSISNHDSFELLIGKLIKSRTDRILRDFYDQLESEFLLSAHDSIRFIGDLLAYVHSIIVNENELISGLLAGLSRTSDISIIEDILKCLTQPLKSRIETIVRTESNLPMIFNIFNILDLYSIIYKKLTKSKLLETLDLSISLCHERVFSLLGDKLGNLSNNSSNGGESDSYDANNDDLQVPEWLIEFYSELTPLLDSSTHDSFMALDESLNEKFHHLIAQKPLECLKIQSLSTKDSLILRINAHDFILSKLLPINCILSDYKIELNDTINDLKLELIENQYNYLISNCKLSNMVNLINMIYPFNHEEEFEISFYQPMVENKLFNKEEIIGIFAQMEEFLPSALIEIQANLINLNSPIIVNDVISNSCVDFIKFFDKFNMICAEYLSEQFKWSANELITLLGVEEL